MKLFDKVKCKGFYKPFKDRRWLYLDRETLTAYAMAIKALEEVQQYRAIGTLEECLRNKDFLDFISDKMNPNDFETYLRLYNALEEKGCEE